MNPRVERHETSGVGGTEESGACVANGAHAVLGRLDTLDGAISRRIGDRPFSA